MATPGAVLESMKQAIHDDPALRCYVAKPPTTAERPFIILNLIPVNLNESSMTGGTQILDLYVSLTAVAKSQQQARLAMEKANGVVASSWQEPALLGPPEITPGGYFPEEEGTWRADSMINLRMM